MFFWPKTTKNHQPIQKTNKNQWFNKVFGGLEVWKVRGKIIRVDWAKFRCPFSVPPAIWKRSSRQQAKALHGRPQGRSDYRRLWKVKKAKTYKSQISCFVFFAKVTSSQDTSKIGFGFHQMLGSRPWRPPEVYAFEKWPPTKRAERKLKVGFIIVCITF